MVQKHHGVNIFGIGLCYFYFIWIEFKSYIIILSVCVVGGGKHRCSIHIHGFLWLEGDPNMETLDWSNCFVVDDTKTFLDRYITTWNPCDIHQMNIKVPWIRSDDTFLLNGAFYCIPCEYYEHLLNRIQIHTNSSAHFCLRKKRPIPTCCYNAPWKFTMNLYYS